jgi:hypothetical protein
VTRFVPRKGRLADGSTGERISRCVRSGPEGVGAKSCAWAIDMWLGIGRVKKKRGFNELKVMKTSHLLSERS